MDYWQSYTKSKPKILFITPTPPPYAGPEVVSAALLASEELHSRYDVRHLRSNVNNNNRDKGKIHLLNLFRFAGILIKYVRILLTSTPNAVYTLLAQNRIGFVRDTIYIMLASLAGVRIFCQFHGEEFFRFYEAQPEFLQRLTKSVLSRTEIMVVQGESLKNQFFGIIDYDKLRIVPNGVDASMFDRHDALDEGSDTGKVRVLFLSGLWPSKGFVDLHEVALEIAGEENGFEFIFAGERCDQDRNIMRDRNGRKISAPDSSLFDNSHSQIKFTGAVRGEEKIRLFLSADIFVLPSYSESYPTVVLEAMAAGLPLIVTSVGALPEILKEGENCWFVTPGDRTELKEKILALSADVLLMKSMGEANRELAQSELTIEKMQGKLVRVFDEVYYPYDVQAPQRTRECVVS